MTSPAAPLEVTESRQLQDRQRLRAVVFLAISLCLLAVLLLQARTHRNIPVAEDSAIFLRYSQNLNARHEIAFNHLGPRVEGATSLPFVLLTSLALSSGAPLLQAPQLVCGAFLLVTVLLLSLYVSRHPNWPLILFVLALSLVYSNVVPLVFEGFDAPVAFFASCLTAILLAQVVASPGRSPWPFLASAVFLGVFRPDGLTLAVAALVAFCWHEKTRAAILSAGCAAFAILAYELWRLNYFGYPLPNAFYVKHHGATIHLQTWVQVTKAFVSLNPAVALCLLLLVAALTFRVRLPFIHVAACLIGLLGLMQWAAISDEMNHYYRFQLPSLAWFLVSVCSPTASSPEGGGMSARRLTLGWLFASALVAIACYPRFRRFEPGDTAKDSARDRSIGLAIGRLVTTKTIPPTTKIVVTEAGYVPLLSGLPTLDAWGLNDVRVAHQGLTAQYLEAWDPQIAYVHIDPTAELSGWQDMTRLLDGWLEANSFVLVATSARAGQAHFQLLIKHGAPWAEELVKSLRTEDGEGLYEVVEPGGDVGAQPRG